MTGGKCARCGAEESVFWYPYAFGVAPVPDITSHMIMDCQRYMLCDVCQEQFMRFMRAESRYYKKADCTD